MRWQGTPEDVIEYIKESLLNKWVILEGVAPALEAGSKMDREAIMKTWVPRAPEWSLGALASGLLAIADLAEEGARWELRKNRGFEGGVKRKTEERRPAAEEAPPTSKKKTPSTEMRRARKEAKREGDVTKVLLYTTEDIHVRYLMDFARRAAPWGKQAAAALRTARPEAALLSLYGKRRLRTLKGFAQVLQGLVGSLGSMEKVLQIMEEEIVDFLWDMADKPCGKRVPGEVVKTISVIWNKMGMPTTIGSLVRGTAAKLGETLAAASLKPVRKALHLLLVMIYALELEISKGKDSVLSDQLYALMGQELTKTYVSGRYDDMRWLDWHGLSLSPEYWGGESAFMSTKTTGAGREVSILPAWVIRSYSVSGKDWVGPFITSMKERGLVPEGKWFITDMATGEPMEYGPALRLTRLGWTKIPMGEACRAMATPGNQEEIMDYDETFLPEAFCMQLGLHSARGFFTWLGRTLLGMSPKELKHLLRHSPDSSADDYVRDSRAMVLGTMKRIIMAIRGGQRPDESLNSERALARGGK